MKQPKLFFFFLLLLSTIGHAQITDIASFPTNAYIKRVCTLPYPVVDEDAIRALRKDTVGATRLAASAGQDNSNDDNALESLFNTAKGTSKKVAIIPPGNYIISKKTTISLSGNLTVFAYGATFRKADLSGNTWIN